MHGVSRVQFSVQRAEIGNKPIAAGIAAAPAAACRATSGWQKPLMQSPPRDWHWNSFWVRQPGEPQANVAQAAVPHAAVPQAAVPHAAVQAGATVFGWQSAACGSPFARKGWIPVAAAAIAPAPGAAAAAPGAAQRSPIVGGQSPRGVGTQTFVDTAHINCVTHGTHGVGPCVGHGVTAVSGGQGTPVGKRGAAAIAAAPVPAAAAPAMAPAK